MATSKKKHLIELMIEAGVKWPNGAEYATQDKRDLYVWFYTAMPKREGVDNWTSDTIPIGSCDVVYGKALPSLCRKWHKTIVTREQYAEALADTAMTQVAKHEVGEWEPVEWGDWSIGDEVRFDGFTDTKHDHWSFKVGSIYVIGARMVPISGKGQQPSCNWGFSFSRRKIEPEAAPSKSNQAQPPETFMCRCAAAPLSLTIEQLTADYHAKAAEADRLQSVADEALKAADDALLALEKAGELIGLVISIDAKPKQAEQPNITDWRDLRVGDVIWVGDSPNYSNAPAGEYSIVALDSESEHQPVAVDWDGRSTWPKITERGWRFIRRP